MTVEAKELLAAALAAREKSYSPYSGYAVGAALLGESGAVYTGCNVENASYPAGCCAERTALFHAVARGERAFRAIAVVGGPAGISPPLPDYAYPCGICRQALWEFAPSLAVYVGRGPEDYRTYTLRELLPESFGPEHLETV